MATTTNFGWETPDDTDLVKDGALAMRTLGNAIDTSLVDLKGGTTGQVLSKTSNTDMDFTWVTSDDANAIQNVIVDAKGDLIAASAADTPARLAVGNNGETLVADSSASTGLRWQGNFAAGKNVVINGDFRVNQRSFTSITTDQTYGFDRWLLQASSGATYTPQTFTLGSAPVAGYEGRNFARIATTGQSAVTTYTILTQRIESVRTFANQTVTLSFWAKADSGTPSVALELSQNFGSGGSPSASVTTSLGKVTLSTSWTRYSATVAIPSISGKTVGTTTDGYLELNLWTSAGSNFNARTSTLGIQTATIDFWGVQLEAGNTATAFQTATGTLAGELQAAQRYYWRISGATAANVGLSTICFNGGTTPGVRRANVPLPTAMRVRPTIAIGGTHYIFTSNLTNLGLASLSSALNSTNFISVDINTTNAGTAGQAGWWIIDSNSANDFLEASAEL